MWLSYLYRSDVVSDVRIGSRRGLRGGANTFAAQLSFSIMRTVVDQDFDSDR